MSSATDINIRMSRREFCRLLCKALHENAGEEKVGEYDESAAAEAKAASQGRLHSGKRQTGEGDLDRLQVPPLPEEPRDLGHIAISIGIAASPPNQQHHRFRSVHRSIPLLHFAEPLVEKLGQERCNAEVASVPKDDVWIAKP